MRLKLSLFAAVLACLALSLPLLGLAQADRQVLVLTAEGPLTPAVAEYLERGLSRAEREGAEAVIFQLDTPGGELELTNRIVQVLRASQVPVVIYVSPPGAIAGSAGTVVTLAGHAAAMAPETAIGAASPVGPQGEDLGDTIEAKTKEILRATIRSLAERRGENAIALAEATVQEAKAASASEALEAGLVDFVAKDVDDLLLQLDGFEVELGSGLRNLQTADASILEVPMSFIERLLQALTNPNIVFILMAVGVQALLIEISSPGGWVAGFIGAVCLALGAYGLGVLPVNWFGLLFLIIAFVLFLAEVKTPSFGALSVAGLLSFILGALVLFNSPGTPAFQRVSIPLVIGSGLVTAGLFLFIVTFALRAQRRPVEVGSEALVGQWGVVDTELAPFGKVFVAGELWSAKVKDPSARVEAGKSVQVVSVEGLKLQVQEP